MEPAETRSHRYNSMHAPQKHLNTPDVNIQRRGAPSQNLKLRDHRWSFPLFLPVLAPYNDGVQAMALRLRARALRADCLWRRRTPFVSAPEKNKCHGRLVGRSFFSGRYIIGAISFISCLPFFFHNGAWENLFRSDSCGISPGTRNYSLYHTIYLFLIHVRTAHSKRMVQAF